MELPAAHPESKISGKLSITVLWPSSETWRPAFTFYLAELNHNRFSIL